MNRGMNEVVQLRAFYYNGNPGRFMRLASTSDQSRLAREQSVEMYAWSAYGTVILLVAPHNAAGFGRPTLSRKQHVLLHHTLGPDTALVASCSSRLRCSQSRTLSLARGPTRNTILMMAKKRRRRRVDDSSDDGEGRGRETSTAPEGLKDGDEGDEEEQRLNQVDGVMMAPLPSELDVSEDLEEDRDEAARGVEFQPATDAREEEMVSQTLGSGAEVGDKLSTRKAPSYSFGLEVQLPVESEGRDSDNQMIEDTLMSADGAMPLPSLSDLAKKSRKKDRVNQTEEMKATRKVSRGDVAAFTSLLELDPEADSDEALFTSESYDAFSSILGEGKPFLGIANSYLQSGHTVLLGLTLLCGFVDLPGFPLTQLPYDLREFLKTGLAVVYAINLVISYLSFMEARRIDQPAPFWALKGFVLGGLAFNELSQIEMKDSKGKRSSGRRRN